MNFNLYYKTGDSPVNLRVKLIENIINIIPDAQLR